MESINHEEYLWEVSFNSTWGLDYFKNTLIEKSTYKKWQWKVNSLIKDETVINWDIIDDFNKFNISGSCFHSKYFWSGENWKSEFFWIKNDKKTCVLISKEWIKEMNLPYPSLLQWSYVITYNKIESTFYIRDNSNSRFYKLNSKYWFKEISPNKIFQSQIKKNKLKIK